MQTLNGGDLRRKRLRLGWSREQFAHSVGVSAETVALWEEGSEKIGCPVVVEQVLRRNEDRFENDQLNAPAS